MVLYIREANRRQDSEQVRRGTPDLGLRTRAEWLEVDDGDDNGDRGLAALVHFCRRSTTRGKCS